MLGSAKAGSGDGSRARRVGLASVALLLAKGVLGLAHPAVTLLCAGAEPGAPAACLAYANAFRSVSYPVRWAAPERWEGAPGGVVVIPGAEADRLSDEVRARVVAFVEAGGDLVTALDTPLARTLGLGFADAPIAVAGVRDAAAPDLPIRWRATAHVRPFTVPENGTVFSWTETHKFPLVAAFRRGKGNVLFLGVELDDSNPLGTSRFPYFLQAVGSAFEVSPPLVSRRLVVYADLGDHKGQDPEAIAKGWRRRGIREVHVGTWDAFEAKWGLYERLIAACHRRGILVYAWFELPEVTRPFWDAHPEWREKTATGADAHVDWRRLMALSIPECFQAVAGWTVDLLERFDWDGADLAEVYFESPMGLEQPELFTPMNDAVRETFRARSGFDPMDLFDEESPRFFERDPAALDAFLSYRRDAAVDLHERLLGVLAGAREHKPYLDLVLTLVDALYDTRMRDRVGIDTQRIVALGRRFPFELQVEDPFTLWVLGPERYAKIAADYARIVAPGQRLAVDVNVVPREGDVRPTAQQTGLELYRLVAEARLSFPRVCLYSEATVYPQDGSLLPSALAATASLTPSGARGAVVESDGTVELSSGADSVAVRIDGRDWPAVRGGGVLLPRGRHLVEWGEGPGGTTRLRLLDITGVLLDATAESDALNVRYASPARAFVLLPFRPRRADLDGKPLALAIAQSESGFVLAVPPGEHVLVVGP
ncbi:MAG: hypothetical protein ABR961_13060 [Thermoanaerobaculaceae bacterium]